MAEEGKAPQPIIIKRIKKGGGHHGGAWKVAYADFVTAMMAFFLLLWLLNVTTEEQKDAISNYFDPTHPKVSTAQSGAGGVLGGLSISASGSMVSNTQPIISRQAPSSALNNREKQAKQDQKLDPSEEPAQKQELEKAKEALRKEEEDHMKAAKAALEKAIESSPELKAMKDNLLVDLTPEGLRIQIIDREGNPMFPSGSAKMFDKTQILLKKVGEIIRTQPNKISIRGHTDSVPYGQNADYTNWELSADRANASRRVLLETALPPSRIHNVVGKADTDHLVPKDPQNARNRRISIILLKEELTNPDYKDKVKKTLGAMKAAEAKAEAKTHPAPKLGGSIPETVPSEPAKGHFPKMGTFRKSSGAVEFP